MFVYESGSFELTLRRYLTECILLLKDESIGRFKIICKIFKI